MICNLVTYLSCSVSSTIRLSMQVSNHSVGSPTVLMMTFPLRHLPLAHHHATICSAGSKGYCAVKEMLQSGVPGHTLLIESVDLREIKNLSQECCLIYNCSEDCEGHSYSHHVPATTKHVTLYSNCVRLPPLLLLGCSGLTTLDLSPLSQVTEVQESFLEGCSGLTTLDLSALSKVTEVKGFFLQDCSSLTSLDLSPLSQVTLVKGFFLAGCSGLTTLDLSPLSQLTLFPGLFLMGCSGLTTLDLSPLSRVRKVEGAFLHGCQHVVVENPPMCPPPRGWAVQVNSTTDVRKWVRK
jgi:hypothetical protein